jgi:hypothetical protein
VKVHGKVEVEGQESRARIDVNIVVKKCGFARVPRFFGPWVNVTGKVKIHAVRR